MKIKLYERYLLSRNTVRKMTDTESSWLACALDGEGSIGIYTGKDGRRAEIQLVNTNYEFVQHAKELVGGIGSTICRHNYSPHGSKTPEIRNRVIYQWSLKGSNRCYVVLRQIIPYLIIKKNKAEAIINEIDEHPFGRWNNQTTERRKLASSIAARTWSDPNIRERRIISINMSIARRKTESMKEVISV